MATTTDYLNKLVTQKNTLADNLVTKGVTATHDETLETLVPKVLQISGGGGGQGNNGIYPIGKNGRPTGDAVVPEGVTSLYQYIFYSDAAVTSVTLPTTLTSLNDYAFYQCTSLTSVQLNNCNITNIPMYCFAYSAITNFTMPQALTNIESRAFINCTGLQSITFRKNNDVSYIDIRDNAFENCSALTTVDFETDDILIYPSSNVFSKCTSLGNEAVMKIIDHLYTGSVTERCFYGCKGITDITISKSGTRMFSWCTNLNHCKILESETCIYAGLFDSCQNLTSVELPATITKYTNNALTTNIDSNNYFLCGCNNLESVTVGEGWNMSMRLDVTANLTVESMVGIFNNLKDLTGETAKVLTLGSANILKLKDEQRAIATNKNWTLA